jgi:CRP-like cAMP-binding protein
MRRTSQGSASGRPVAIAVWAGGNRILAHVPAAELAVLRKTLTLGVVTSGQVMYKQRGPIETVYFPDTAVMSLLKRMESGAVVGVGTVGNESAVGLSLFLGAKTSIVETIAQIPGELQQMTASAFLSAMDELPEFHRIVAACTHGLLAQVSQTAACNRLHGIEEQCARWLLLTHDRAGGVDSFPLTHQFLSHMLGVRRAGVTEALGALTLAALIKSTAGRITILDRAGLESAACECHAIVYENSGMPFRDEVKRKSPARK